MLSIWHVYGEQADSPMNRLLTEFNDTVGREKGILLNVTNMTNSAAIGGQLQDAKAGKPGALDYPLRLVELNALEQGSGELYKGSWYDLTNETFRASWMEFARALVQGDILISDLYSNTQVMTGETLAGLSSSAAILYYNDFVTYPDNTTEPTDLLLTPLPHAAGTATPLMPQAGVGLCARPAVPALLCCWMPPSTPAWREQSIPAPGCMCKKAGPTPPPCPCCSTAAAPRWARPTA